MLMYLKPAGCMENSADPDQMIQSAASHQGPHCLLRSVCFNTYSYYGKILLVNGIYLYENFCGFSCKIFLHRNFFKKKYQ